MNKAKNIQEPTKKAWSIGVVVARFLMLFKPKCPKCGSRDNTIQCYWTHPNGKSETGRQCNNCTHFGYY